MKTYYVTFHYTLEVRAETQEKADALAWKGFAENIDSISAGDFVSSEPEEMWRAE